jgi:hypothetical protein
MNKNELKMPRNRTPVWWAAAAIGVTLVWAIALAVLVSIVWRAA